MARMVTLFLGLGMAMGGAAIAEPSLQGTIQINGSSTVAPILLAASEMYGEVQPKVKITVGVSGTGGGFKKFLEDQPKLRTDITNASRPIRPAEVERAKAIGVEFIEIPVAIDGLAIVAHKDNPFCNHLTLDELKRIWEPGSAIQNWKDIRPGFPDLKLRLFGAGTDSGTFDYFTEVICGKEKASRSDYTASENDNVLVQGIAGDKGALGYFGYSYYEANKSKLKLIAVDRGDGQPVAPSVETIRSGAYHPLSRPLFIYVNADAAKRPEVRSFVDFLLAQPRKIVEHPRVNYVGLSDGLYEALRTRFQEGRTGTAFGASGGHGPIDLGKLYGGQ